MTAAAAGGTRSRVAWGLLDQVLSSGANFVVVVLVARSLSATGFGSFSVAFEVYVVSAFIVRGLASDPLASAHAGDDRDQMRWAVRAGASTALVVSLAVAAVSVLASLLLDGTLAAVLLALAFVLPGLTLQDYLRYALIVQGRARATFLNDLLWAVAQLPLLWLAIRADGDAASLLLAWGVAGNLAALVGLWQVRSGIASPRSIGTWLRRHRTLWPYFLLDNVIVQATTLILVIVIAAAVSLAEIGGFRAAMTVFAPLTILGRGIVGVAVPELARRRSDPLAVRRVALTIACLLAPVAVVWGALAQLVPTSVGQAFLGESWLIAEPVIFLAGFTPAVGLFTVGAAVGLRALGAGRDGLSARIIVSVVSLLCAALGGVLDGAHGVFLALALSAPFQVAVWWRLLVKASAREAGRAPEGA